MIVFNPFAKFNWAFEKQLNFDWLFLVFDICWYITSISDYHADAWTVCDEFSINFQACCEQNAIVLDKVSMRVEEAVTELVEIFIEQAHRVTTYLKPNVPDGKDDATSDGGEGTDKSFCFNYFYFPCTEIAATWGLVKMWSHDKIYISYQS